MVEEDGLGFCEYCEENDATLGCGTCGSVLCEDCCGFGDAPLICPICAAEIDEGGEYE